MDIFNKIKDFVRQVNEIEYSISTNKKEFLEVYERNLALEQEILERTQELDQANKAFLTLKHVWELMNSSQPLASVLDKLVNSLHGEMGYINSTILKLNEDENGFFFNIKAFSMSPILKALQAHAGGDFENYRLRYDETSPVARCLKEHKILYTKEYLEAINNLLIDIDAEKIQQINKLGVSKFLIIIPLFQNQNPFGVMMVFSPREGVTDKELNFLSLFANQVEMAITIANLFETMKKEAVTDSLTELYNRRYFTEELKKEADRARRLNQPFTIISLDLDYLKKINDTYGHMAGDIAIKAIADVMKKNARSIDIPARLGGEEFSILLPGIDSNGGMVAAERIRAAIENEEVPQIGKITASIGVGTYPEHSMNIDELVEMTDQAMYRSKINGRNRVTIAKQNEEESWQEVAYGAFMDILNKRRIPVPEELTRELTSKLDIVHENSRQAKESLYSIVDMISKSYNPSISSGTTKSKISLAIKLAKKLEISKEDIDRLKIAMLLYDIGNIMIPEEIFNKTSPLTPDEKQKIHEHPIIAAREILQPISSITDIIPIIENHHENWDGTGYPNQKSGAQIPISSQIILLIDAYTAMSQDRPYRKAMSTEKIIDIITRESGKKWNEKVVEEFVGLLNELVR
ncbi:TPA: diguanylate cyclase [Candidatus Spyradomonas excrementavium]|nr:diguanylate cyclase [Candidatus Spyradomonas excrementavium]